MSIIKPEKFGAVGDGINNDAAALWEAVKSAEDGDTLLLAKNKTYYIAPYGEAEIAGFKASAALETDVSDINCPAALTLNHIKNFTVKGDNTTVLIERPLFYCDINYTENLTVEGIIFDYRVRPFAAAELVELDRENNSAIFKTDRPLYIDGETEAGDFGVVDMPDGRYHMFTKTCEPVDKEKNLYKYVFDDDAGTVSRFDLLKDHLFIAPLPGFAHRIERAFSITNNKNFSMVNCTVRSMARFGFALFCNEGITTFKNLQVRKDPLDKANIVGWRDCFHVKENHCRYIWDNCYAEYCYDDIFNISASTLNVEEVLAEDDIDFRWMETDSTYCGVKVGDTVEITDLDTGRDYGRAIIKEIVCQEGKHNRYRFKTPFKGVKSGINMKAHVIDCAAPGSEIKNCDFRGTFRFRGPVEIKDTHFYVARFWIDLCMPVEGPVPKHIHFTNCRFDCDDEVNPYFHIVAQKNSIEGEPQYHLEDIVFKNCELPLKTLEIAETDKPFVKFE